MYIQWSDDCKYSWVEFSYINSFGSTKQIAYFKKQILRFKSDVKFDNITKKIKTREYNSKYNVDDIEDYTDYYSSDNDDNKNNNIDDNNNNNRNKHPHSPYSSEDDEDTFDCPFCHLCSFKRGQMILYRLHMQSVHAKEDSDEKAYKLFCSGVRKPLLY